ncbi:MAG: TraR/DksA C4-type zinc finger protein [Micrococcales bacterium]|nr:TraR/DksA C4-type zinc finger protein [Micrococcales bacterium]
MAGKALAHLPVLDQEEPWTEAEVAQVRQALKSDRERLGAEANQSVVKVSELMRDCPGDEADIGAATYEREHGISLAANARDLLEQTEHALGRIETGQYGSCASCAHPIGKMRLMAFPRATLCISCKKEQERG